MDKIKQRIEWVQKRLEIQGKPLDQTQIELVTFALHEIVSKNHDQSLPTDNEIDKMFTYNGIYGSTYNKYKREGAKIIRDMIKGNAIKV